MTQVPTRRAGSTPQERARRRLPNTARAVLRRPPMIGNRDRSPRPGWCGIEAEPMFERPSPPRFDVPKGSCDCHVHLFGPFDRYPLDRDRLYTPDPALTPDLLAMLDGAGVARAVLVQPSAYGTDNRCMLDAMAAHPDRFRGVVVVDPGTPNEDLERMRARGAR